MGNSNFFKKNPLKLLSLALMATAISGVATAQITVRDLGQEVSYGRISVFDIDGDDDLDLIVGGESAGSSNIQVYTNNGSGVFTPVVSPLNALYRPAYDWNDINQDGKADIILNGFGPFAGIYNTNGAGTFSASAISLPQIAPSCGFADLNNDGYLDIFVLGNDNTGKSKILFSNAGNGFTESAQFNNYNFTDPEVSVVDYDNDKDLDLFITAGFEVGANSRFSKLFVNNSGVFTETVIAGLLPKGNGSSTWGDYNGDGFPDLLLNGDGYLDSGEDADNYRLYSNNGNGTFTAIRAFNYRQNFTGGGGKFLDWDNDGDLDIVVTGYNGTTQATDIYINAQGGFTAYANNAAIPGSSEGTVEVGDADNDGDLDLFITGFSGNNWNGTGGFNRNIAVVALNPNNVANAAPSAPTNLVVTGNSSQLNFSWTASTDATTPQNSLTYNLFLVDANGKWFYYAAADTTSGKNKIAKLGNVQHNKGWIVKNLPAGTYRWGVQAIDNSYKGSLFAKKSFIVNANGTLPIVLGDYKAIIEGNNAVIKWQSLSETNTSKYIVERSLDGILFTKIGSIDVEGNSTVAHDYAIKDYNPANGKNYYRLTSIDIDGKTQVFDILVLNFQISSGLITVFPNPVNSSTIGIRIPEYDGYKIIIQLIDIKGQTIATKYFNAIEDDGNYSLQLNQKPVPGLYSIKISGDKIDKTIKVLVD